MAEDRRRDADRIVRLETVMGRVETDIVALTGIYRTMAESHQTMTIEAIKSQSKLEQAINGLTATMVDQTPRINKLEDVVADHEQWKYKIIGMISAVVVIVNLLVWLAQKFF